MSGKDLMMAILEMRDRETDTSSPLMAQMESLNNLCDEIERNQDDGKN